MTNLYESAKQNELDEKNKIKHLERSVRALKSEKDQLFTQILDLQERVNLQAKDLQEAQTQRKLAVQEFTEVNEKVNELRSKNVKLSNDLLNKEDEIEELKRIINENKIDLEKRDKLTEELKNQLKFNHELVNRLENEKLEALQRLKAESAKNSIEPAPPVVNHADEALTELNNQLNRELKQLQAQIVTNTSQITQLEETNTNLQNEIQQLKEKNVSIQRESNVKFQEDLKRFQDELTQSKDKEISFLQSEVKKLLSETEKLNNAVNKLQTEKKSLEDEVALFNESKQAMSKYDWQMNEILQMVNEEKVVRGHLRSLASKLIEEVDTLRSQTGISLNSSNNSNQLSIAAAAAGASVNGPNSAAWKNRCSERRDRINAQNMQIALEKEFQAKEQLIEENNSLKLEIDNRQHKINELQLQIDQINKELQKSHVEIKDLREDLFTHQKALASTGVSNLRSIGNSSIVPQNTNVNNFNENTGNLNGFSSASIQSGTSLSLSNNNVPTLSSDSSNKINLTNGNNSTSAIGSTNGTNLLRHISTTSATSVSGGQQQPNALNQTQNSVTSLNPIYPIDDISIIDHNLDQSDTTNLPHIAKIDELNNSNSSHIQNKNVATLKQQQLQSNTSTLSSTSSNTNNSTSSNHTNGHKFEVVSFHSIERCEYCCGILYGICRQAVKCKDKNCNYLCHPKCRQFLPLNCPININQRVKLKGVDFTKGIGTLMQGTLKVPKAGGVRKGWQDHYVFLSNARLFVCPIVDNKPSLIPFLIVDIRDPQFSVSAVSESDVIHASKRDLPCIFKMIVSKVKNQANKQQLLFCAKDEKDKNSWINVLRDLNDRLIQSSKQINTSSSILLPIEAKEICDAATIRNAVSACVYDSERLLIGSDEGIDVIEIKTDYTIQRFHDKKTFLIDVFREEKVIVAISGKTHQIYIFPSIIIEGISADTIKIDETKGCNLFCIGKLALNSSSPPASPVISGSDISSRAHTKTSTTSSSSSSYISALSLLCVAIKKVVSIYEINSNLKPKYKKLREIELPMVAQSMQIINNQLCIGFQSDFALYSLAHETAPIALIQADRDKSLQFLIKDPVNALMAIQITNEEYLLVFETLGIYVNTHGCRSRIEEIMWPSKPLHVAFTDPYLFCFCERGIDVFHVKTGEWIQILQLSKTKPLDKAGAICLCNESQDFTRLIHLKAIGEEEVISLLSKNRSLVKSKYRKGSLNRTDEAYLSLVNNSSNTSHNNNQLAHNSGSTALNYSNSTASSSGASSTQNSNSRKSIISNPINFQHLQHMGPNDGKTFMTADVPIHLSNGSSHTNGTNSQVTSGLPPISGTRIVNVSTLNNEINSNSNHSGHHHNTKKSTSSSGVRPIAKNDISAPTNFRHVVRGLDDFGPHISSSNKDVIPIKTNQSTSSANTNNNNNNSKQAASNSSRVANSQASSSNSSNQPATSSQQHPSIKSSSLSSSSSSSSSIMHSPNSPTSSNNENLSQAISNTLKANSVLYNDSLLSRNQSSSNNSSHRSNNSITTLQNNNNATNHNNNNSNNPGNLDGDNNSCFDNVSYFKIEEETAHAQELVDNELTAIATNTNQVYNRHNQINISSGSSSLSSNDFKRQSNGDVETG